MDMDMVRPRKDPWGLSPVGGPWEAWGSLMDLCGRSRLVGPPRSSCVAYVGRVFGFTRIGEEERRDGEAIALHKTHIWANSLKPVCFLCFLLIWCPLLPFIETGTLKIYTKMVLYMKNELLTSIPPMGLKPTLYQP